MCRPNPTDSVRPKNDLYVYPMRGSRGVSLGRQIKLTREHRGIAEGPATKPDHFIILFEHGEQDVVRALLHHTQIKGVEAADMSPRP